ncbi:hypothetical protein OsJ_05493 [Oryza sativa Japonica Group]|uniref:Reverse transcriptase domain-containing protein n=1 Tax=Oryza sativa subsp. japonica TaxID=39947 RepID=B9F365_ORYSJ|nr:hypothetical protein OsJ_05493 [Oryza sativa Japonica Group]
MGFGDTWRKWTMSCVDICPIRGLRQGDPLSPYLFLFIADGLSHILEKKSLEGSIQPIKVCRGAPGISHLLFADDSLLFFKAEVDQARSVKEALSLYEKSTGQLINPAKCSLLFSEFCSQERQEEIKAVLQIQRTGFEDKYLGLPTPEARQAWRLIAEPNSLCARLLKAKYYPNGSLIDTAFPSNTSPTWKGIEHGLELLKRGLIWRVRDGRTTKIWRNRWVAHGEKVEVIQKKNWNRLTYVHELLIPGTNAWNEALIRHVATEEDANAILKIHVPNQETSDFPAWHYEKTCLFSVRSAYKLAWNLTESAQVQTSSSTATNGERKLWENVWKADVQPKVKIFAWKLAHSRLPTWENK